MHPVLSPSLGQTLPAPTSGQAGPQNKSWGVLQACFFYQAPEGALIGLELGA